MAGGRLGRAGRRHVVPWRVSHVEGGSGGPTWLGSTGNAGSPDCGTRWLNYGLPVEMIFKYIRLNEMYYQA